jgi:hypothetical protein
MHLGFVLGLNDYGHMPVMREASFMLKTSVCADAITLLVALAGSMPAQQTGAASRAAAMLDSATLVELKGLYKQLIAIDPSVP